MEGAHMGVPKHAAVEVLWGLSLTLQVALLIETDISGDRGLGLGSWLSSGPCFGAAVLHEEVLDALDGRVVCQVPPAGPSRPAGAVGIRAQGTAVTGVPTLPANPTTKVQGGSYKLRVTLQYFALCPY